MANERQDVARDLEALRERLGRLRRFVRLCAFLRGAGHLLAAALAVALASFAIDRTFRLSVEWRAAALAAYAAAVGWVAWRRCAHPLALGLPASALAELVERRFPRLEDLLRSAVDFAADALAASAEEPEIGRAMKRRVVREAARAAAGLPLREVVDAPRVARASALGLAAAAAGVAIALLSGGAFRIWFERNVLLGAEEWPYRTVLEVEGFSAERPSRGVPRGDPLALRVRARGEVPDRVRIRLRYGREAQRWNLAREGADLFVYEMAEVTEPFEFRVEGGDYRSGRYRVEVLERPEIERCRLTLSPPAYTRRPPRTIAEDLGEVSVPEGTRIDIEAVATKPLRAAWLETEGRRIQLAVAGEDPRRISGGYVPEAGGMATLGLEDAEGVPPDRWVRFAVAPVPDRAPAVSARAKGAGSMILSRALIPLKVRATDDYGVTATGVAYEIAAEGAPPARGESPPEAAGEETELSRDLAFDLEPLRVPEDRRVDVKAFALDGDGIRGPKRGFSPPVSFLVVTKERLLEDFLTREEEQRRVLERAVEDERAVRDAAYRMVDGAWKAEGPLDEPTAAEMVRMARKERELARQMAAVSQAMRSILDEMRVNRIAEAVETERLLRGVIEPLGDLSETAFPSLAARLGTIRELAKAEDRIREGVALALGMEEAIAAMERVVQAMRRLEGFTEVVNRLHAVLKIHSESAEEAAKLYRKEIEEIFEDLPDGGSK